MLGALFIATARAELQLTPKFSVARVDGATIKFLAFSDGSGKQITYGPPFGWECSGVRTRLTLRPPKRSQAEGTISTIKLSHPGIFDDERMKKLTAEVIASVPGGSTNVTLVSEEKNPLLIAQKETFLVIVSYTFYGENYQRSMMFLNRGNEQVRFQLVSRAIDFEDLQTNFYRSHFTWQNL